MNFKSYEAFIFLNKFHPDYEKLSDDEIKNYSNFEQKDLIDSVAIIQDGEFNTFWYQNFRKRFDFRLI